MKLRRLGNNGSGIVTVVICVMLIMILGSALLFTAFSGFQIKVSQRKAAENFYDAETAMSQVRAGVQQIVTEAIADAYSNVLISYNVSSDIEGAFHTSFKNALLAWKNDAAAANAFIPVAGGDDGTEITAWLYDPDVLRTFIATPGGTAELHYAASTTNAGMGDVVVGESSIVLKGVSVTYVRNGYETTVSSDISINMPGFTYVMSEHALDGIPEFAMIAQGGLTQSGYTDLVISGSAYAGYMTLGSGWGRLTVRGGTLITGGDVRVEEPGNASARFLLENSATLWANRVYVGGDGTTIDLMGDTYVADDLELNGTSTGAALSGRYYGFGYDTSNSGQSSSIIINGKNTSLDLSQLSTLMLAGQSFIGTTTTGATDILMGQSVSVKSDQLAYLVPEELLTVAAKNVTVVEGEEIESEGIITGANPYIFTGNRLEYSLDEDYEILPGKTLEDYDAHVRTVTSDLSSAPGAKIVYFYLNFPTKDRANAYFKDYFASHSEAIDQYLEVYARSLVTTDLLQTSGNTYGSADGELTLIDPVRAGTINTTADRLSSMYRNLSVTLSANVPAESTSATNPFQYIIRRSAITEYLTEETTEFRDITGEIVGLIVRGNVSYDAGFAAAYPDLRIIIALGNVDVSQQFNGLIIAEGTVSMTASLYADKSAVVNALTATAEIDHGGTTISAALSSFTVLGAPITTGGSDDDPVTDFSGSWDTDALVSYSGWRKN